MLKVLEKQIAKNRLIHAYLFVGSKYQDKLAEALEFANYLKISDTDLLIINNSASETIKIEEIKEIQHALSLKPYQSNFKLAVINHADRMTSEAANSLLKTLEEPPGKSILILISSNEENLLPTIVSRCQKIRLKPTNKLNIELQYPLGEIRKMDLKGKFDLANQLSKAENLQEIFDGWLLEASRYNRKFLDFLVWTHGLLNTNANKRLILENLFLELE